MHLLKFQTFWRTLTQLPCKLVSSKVKRRQDQQQHHIKSSVSIRQTGIQIGRQIFAGIALPMLPRTEPRTYIQKHNLSELHFLDGMRFMYWPKDTYVLYNNKEGKEAFIFPTILNSHLTSPHLLSTHLRAVSSRSCWVRERAEAVDREAQTTGLGQTFPADHAPGCSQGHWDRRQASSWHQKRSTRKGGNSSAAHCVWRKIFQSANRNVTASEIVTKLTYSETKFKTKKQAIFSQEDHLRER